MRLPRMTSKYWYDPENMKVGLAKQLLRREKQRKIMHASDPTSWEYEKARTSVSGANCLIDHYRNYMRRHAESTAADDNPSVK